MKTRLLTLTLSFFAVFAINPIFLISQISKSPIVELSNENSSRGVNNDSTWMHYDDVEMYDSWGFMINGELYDVMAKWDPADLVDYEDWAVSKVKFIIVHDQPIIKVKIWEGENGVEIYSQDVPNYNVGAWTEVVLDEPVDFDHNSVLMVGYEVDMTMTELGGAVTATDDGPPVVGYGNLYRFDGNWYSDFNNHNLRVLIQNNFDAEFTAEKTNICHGDAVDFINMSSGADSYLWTFEGGDPATSTLENPTVTYNTPGNFDVTLEITKDGETDTEYKANYIKANEIPTSIVGDTLVCDWSDAEYSVELHEGSAYTWTVENGTITSGQNTNSITVSWLGQGIGEVSVLEQTIYNCEGNSPEFIVTIDDCTGLLDNEVAEQISIIPNPVSGNSMIVQRKGFEVIEIDIIDINGRVISKYRIQSESTKIDVGHLKTGIYLVKSTNTSGIVSATKFIRN